MRKLARVFGWMLLGLLVSALLGLLVALHWARSESGRRSILTRVLAAAREHLDGALRVGALEGNLTHTLVLRDVELRDADGMVALHVDRLSASYQLIGLLRHRLTVDDLVIEGARLHGRSLADGRFNLAALIKASAKKTSASKPLAIVIGRVRAELELRYDPSFTKDWMRTIAGTVRVDAGASSIGDRRAVKLDALAVRMSLPVIASVDVSGAFTDGPAGAELEALHLTGDTVGQEMEKLSAAVQARGAWHADVRAKGMLRAMAVDVAVTPPTGSIAAHGTVGVTGRGATWSGAAKVRAIDPATVWQGLPHGLLGFDGDGDGENARVRTTLQRLDAELAGAQVTAKGQLTYEHGLAISAAADVDARDLSRLKAIGASGLSGSAGLRAKVERRDGHWLLDADADARRFGVAMMRVGRLTAQLHAVDLQGSARVQASAVDVGPRLRFDGATVVAELGPRLVSLSIAAKGPRSSEVAIAAHGTRLAKEGRFAVDLAIDRVRVALDGETWETRGPGHFRFGAPGIAARLQLGAGEQQLDLDGSYAPHGRLAAHLVGRKLNLERLARLAQVERALPPGILDFTATVGGTVARPVFDLALTGAIPADRGHGLAGTGYHASGHYENENVAGTLAVTALPIERLAPYLPKSLATIKGVIDGKATIGGTRRAPQVTAEIDVPHWQWDVLQQNRARLDVRYGDQKLDAKLSGSFAGAAGPAGAVEVELFAPIDLSRGGGKLVDRLVHTTPITVGIRLHGFDLARLPLDKIGVRLPVTTGIVDGEVKLAGTLHEPTLTAAVTAHKLTIHGVEQIDLELHADYRRANLGLSLTGDLQGTRLINADAETHLDFHKLIDGERWQDGALRADAAISSYALTKWKQVAGALTAHASLRGTIAKPEGSLDFTVDGLSIGDMRFTRFGGAGHYDAQRGSLQLDAEEKGGGLFRASATLDGGQRITGRLQIERLSLAIGGAGLGQLHELRGNVKADMTVSGTLAQPHAAGSLTIDGGAFALRTQPLVYRDLELALTAVDDRLELRRLSVKVGSGGLSASGSARLDGFGTPLGVDVKAKAARFPVRLGSIAAFVDGQVTVHGERKNGVLSVVATVDKGLAQLPRLIDGKRTQSLAPMPDVTFSDRAERLRRDEVKKELAADAPIKASIKAHIPGPFRVRSSELGTDLDGDLDLEVLGEIIRVTGSVVSTWGRIDLLGRPYEIEHVRVTFDGAPKIDPALDVVLKRAVGDATVIIHVRGTLSHPQLELASEPPIYDQSQIIGIIVSGDPGSTRISDAATDQKIVGAISGVLVNQIKSQIAPGLPIDVIRIDSDNTVAGTSRLEVGKYLTQSIYLSYAHQFGTPSGLHPVNSNEARLQYRFLRRFQVETKFGDAGVGAVNFYWTRRY